MNLIYFYFASCAIKTPNHTHQTSISMEPPFYKNQKHAMAVMNIKIWILLIQMILFLVLGIHAKIPGVIVFGDSTVDTGNNNKIETLLKSNFKPYGRDFEGGRPTGRFSNGKVPGDLISEAFGCKSVVPAYLDPAFSIKDFATGVCFASAGTGYDNATSDVLSVIPLWKEVEYFKEYQTKLKAFVGNEKANEIVTESLYVLSMGTNDFLENYYTPMSQASSKYTVEQYQVYLVGLARNFLTELYGLGARKISLGGLAPIGCLPLERTRNFLSGSGCNEEYNKVARDFNAKLNDLVGKLNVELPGMKVVLSNPYDPLLDIIQKPAQYGFENAAVACCSTGLFEMGYLCDQYSPLTCKDASKYVFWDAFHPTEKTNAILSDRIVKTYLAGFL